MFFHALTFAGSRGSCLNMRLSGWVFKHLPRDPVSVNAMKQTCVIVFLHIYLIPIKSPMKTRLIVKIPFSYAGFLKKNWVSIKLSNIITLFQRHNACKVFANKKCQCNVQTGLLRFLYNVMQNNIGLILSIVKYKAMLKQHVNLMIWTWIFLLLTMASNSYAHRFLCRNTDHERDQEFSGGGGGGGGGGVQINLTKKLFFENYHFSRFQRGSIFSRGGSNFFQGGGGGPIAYSL